MNSEQSVVAYFSAEYAIEDVLPTYAGGLGVLAGDLVMQAGDDGRNLVAFGPAYRHNVAVKTDHTTPPDQQLQAQGFRLLPVNGEQLTLRLNFPGWEKVAVRVWEREFGTARLMLLDTDFAPNSAVSRNLMANLYDPNLRTRLQQQFLLAAAALAVMKELGIEPSVYHLNEGHMAWVILALVIEQAKQQPGLKMSEALAKVGQMVVGTKHTILPGAGDFVELGLLQSLFGPLLQQYGLSVEELFEAGHMADAPQTFSTTHLLLAVARISNGVSEMHCVAERAAHPESHLIPVTNGVYAPRWQHDDVAGRGEVTDEELWRRHEENRARMIEHVNKLLGTKLAPDRLTAVWARRFAAYKRPTLLIHDMERLERLLRNEERPVQVVISGNANEADVEGLEALEAITAAVQQKSLEGRLVYLPHYVTETTKRLAGGADVWLNTPVRGMEACGTSGMKASLNGALQFSSSDGWFDEIDRRTIGWVLPEAEAETALYEILENEIAPMFYDRDSAGAPVAWLKKMRAAIELMEKQFTAHRMLDDYYEKMYQHG
jgi:alpha-glucan phosphorylase-like protein